MAFIPFIPFIPVDRPYSPSSVSSLISLASYYNFIAVVFAVAFLCAFASLRERVGMTNTVKEFEDLSE